SAGIDPTHRPRPGSCHFASADLKASEAFAAVASRPQALELSLAGLVNESVHKPSGDRKHLTLWSSARTHFGFSFYELLGKIDRLLLMKDLFGLGKLVSSNS